LDGGPGAFEETAVFPPSAYRSSVGLLPRDVPEETRDGGSRARRC
jgi:hypothetical protein